MKKIIFCSFVLWIMIFRFAGASAGDCYSDTVVKRWIEERDRAAEKVVQDWARGASPDEFAPGVAVIIADELFVCSQCRDQKNFLKEKIYILKGGSHPKVENVPGMILEHLVGSDLLSPWRQFPSDRRKVVRKREIPM